MPHLDRQCMFIRHVCLVKHFKFFVTIECGTNNTNGGSIGSTTERGQAHLHMLLNCSYESRTSNPGLVSPSCIKSIYSLSHFAEARAPGLWRAPSSSKRRVNCWRNLSCTVGVIFTW
mmetsp:Transcript_21347/g.53227  ORF Transcript_21347/g.53227 Transcript_21347/m.53227 type:complete len:117 (+) Transcript_21347:1255-1605(+)